MFSPEVTGPLAEMDNRITAIDTALEALDSRIEALEALNSSVTLTVTPVEIDAYNGSWEEINLEYNIVGGNARWYIERQPEGGEVEIFDNVESLDEESFVSIPGFNFNPTGNGTTSLGIRTLEGDFTHYRFKLLVENAEGNLIASSPLIEVIINEMQPPPSSP